MSAYRRLGLRTRLALALAGVAVASVALATLLSNAGLHSRLDQFARDRLQAAAVHSAQLGATLYGKEHRWTGSAAQLGHLAEMNGYRLVLRDANGRGSRGASCLRRRRPTPGSWSPGSPSAW